MEISFTQKNLKHSVGSEVNSRPGEPTDYMDVALGFCLHARGMLFRRDCVSSHRAHISLRRLKPYQLFFFMTTVMCNYKLIIGNISNGEDFENCKYVATWKCASSYDIRSL